MSQNHVFSPAATGHGRPDDVDPQFRRDLAELLNRYSFELGSHTPDHLLAGFLAGALEAADQLVNERERWYGRENRGLQACQEDLAGVLLNAVGDVVFAPGRGYSPAGFASVMQRAGLALVRIEGGPREPPAPSATVAFRNFEAPDVDRPEPADDHLQRELDTIIERLEVQRRQAAGMCSSNFPERAFGQLEVAVDTAVSRIRVLINEDLLESRRG